MAKVKWTKGYIEAGGEKIIAKDMATYTPDDKDVPKIHYEKARMPSYYIDGNSRKTFNTLKEAKEWAEVEGKEWKASNSRGVGNTSTSNT